MSQNTIEIDQDNKTISIADIGLYSIDVTDDSLGTSVDVTTEELSSSGPDITVVTQTNTIIPENPNVTVQISSEPYNAVHINLDVANQVTITDNISMAPAASNSPLISGSNGHFGLGLSNPKYQLELSQDLFAPIISSSKLEVTGNGSGNIFLVKLNDSAESKFVINLEGVTLLGAFSTTPTHVTGGMFYSSSGDFYLG
tara:strand:+ start:301 stop:897 length:597 start_codon:yes stop_codon:yes gene_type:complete